MSIIISKEEKDFSISFFHSKNILTFKNSSVYFFLYFQTISSHLIFVKIIIDLYSQISLMKFSFIRHVIVVNIEL